MAKTQEKDLQAKEAKGKKDKGLKEAKEKDGKALVGRVKKVVKKSRRKMGEEKFEKELRRTIAFLEEIQHKLNGAAPREAEKVAEPIKKADKKADRKKTDKAQAKSKTKSKNGGRVEPEVLASAQPEAAVASE